MAITIIFWPLAAVILVWILYGLWRRSQKEASWGGGYQIETKEQWEETQEQLKNTNQTIAEVLEVLQLAEVRCELAPFSEYMAESVEDIAKLLLNHGSLALSIVPLGGRKADPIIEANSGVIATEEELVSFLLGQGYDVYGENDYS